MTIGRADVLLLVLLLVLWCHAMHIFLGLATTTAASTTHCSVKQLSWAGSCSDASDCNYNGVCGNDGTCKCQAEWRGTCLLYTSPSPRDGLLSRMPSSA